MSDTDRVAPRDVVRDKVYFRHGPGSYTWSEVVLASDYDELRSHQQKERADRFQKECKYMKALQQESALRVRAEDELAALKAENEWLKAFRDDAIQIIGAYVEIVAKGMGLKAEHERLKNACDWKADYQVGSISEAVHEARAHDGE